MKWVSVNNDNFVENFELWEENKKLAGITFSKRTGFVRIVSSLGKRIFSFEKRGLFSQKEFIRNEYGVKMGKLEESRPGAGKGFVELDQKKYFFIYNQNNSGDLILYDESMKTNLLTCSFNALSNGLSKSKSLIDTRFTSLLLVLCWYTFQPHSASAVSTIVNEVDLIIP